MWRNSITSIPYLIEHSAWKPVSGLALTVANYHGQLTLSRRDLCANNWFSTGIWIPCFKWRCSLLPEYQGIEEVIGQQQLPHPHPAVIGSRTWLTEQPIVSSTDQQATIWSATPHQLQGLWVWMEAQFVDGGNQSRSVSKREDYCQPKSPTNL